MHRFWLLLGAFLAGTAVWLMLGSDADNARPAIENVVTTPVAINTNQTARTSRNNKNQRVTDSATPKSPQRAIRFLLQSALDREDMRSVCKLAEKAVASSDEALRHEAITALGWFGADTIPEMLAFIDDPSPKVSSCAFEHVDMALDMVEDNATKVRLIELTLSYAVSDDEARSVLAKLESVKSYQAARCLADLYERLPQDSRLRELIKEEYRDITGKMFVSGTLARYWAEKHIGE